MHPITVSSLLAHGDSMVASKKMGSGLIDDDVE